MEIWFVYPVCHDCGRLNPHGMIYGLNDANDIWTCVDKPVSLSFTKFHLHNGSTETPSHRGYTSYPISEIKVAWGTDQFMAQPNCKTHLMPRHDFQKRILFRCVQLGLNNNELGERATSNFNNRFSILMLTLVTRIWLVKSAFSCFWKRWIMHTRSFFKLPVTNRNSFHLYNTIHMANTTLYQDTVLFVWKPFKGIICTFYCECTCLLYDRFPCTHDMETI